MSLWTTLCIYALILRNLCIRPKNSASTCLRERVFWVVVEQGASLKYSREIDNRLNLKWHKTRKSDHRRQCINVTDISCHNNLLLSNSKLRPQSNLVEWKCIIFIIGRKPEKLFKKFDIIYCDQREKCK